MRWWQTELEHTTESLQRAKRQRARLRDQVNALSDALAAALSDGYWAAQPTTGVRGLLKRGDTEVDLVREVEASPLFDGGWYLREYPKTVRSGLSPALHYVRHGNERSLDPGPRFDTSNYLTRHPDAAAARVPALVHAGRNGHLDEPHDDPAVSPADGVHL